MFLQELFFKDELTLYISLVNDIGIFIAVFLLFHLRFQLKKLHYIIFLLLSLLHLKPDILLFQVALNTINKLEASVTSYQSTIRKLESHVRTLQDERDALHHSVNILRKRLETYEATSVSESPQKTDPFSIFETKS